MSIQIVCLILAWFTGSKEMFFQQPNNIIVTEQRDFLHDSVCCYGAIIYLRDKVINSDDIDENNISAIIKEIVTIQPSF